MTNTPEKLDDDKAIKIAPETHRKISVLAAHHGKTLKAYLSLLADREYENAQAFGGKSEPVTV